MASIFDQFKKGSGEAPQYSTLAPVPANKTAKYVQTFDERAIMVEQPPEVDGTPKGSPKRDPKVSAVGAEDGLPGAFTYIDTANMRADNQVLVRETPTSDKGEKNVWPKATPNALRIGRGDVA